MHKLVFCRALHPTAMAMLEAREDVELKLLTTEFRGPPLQAALAAHIGDADGIMVGLERVDAELLALAPKLRVISRFGVGFDTLDIAGCTRQGVLVGVVNGFFTVVVGINSFITTLGTLFTLEGFTLIISHAQQQTTPGAPLAGTSSGTSISSFASIFGAGTYSELIWAIIIVAILQIALTRTRWGMHTIAVGSNRLAAAEAGVRVRWVVIRNFMVCSTCAGIVGILEAIRTSTITPDPGAANSLLLDAIAAAVIGGTLLAGGSGTVVGAFVGALFLGILQDGLAIKGVNANYLDFYLGLAILLAMGINVYVGRARRRSGIG